MLPRVRFEGVSKAAAPWQTRGPNFDRLPRYETMLAYHGFMTPACVLSYRLYGTQCCCFAMLVPCTDSNSAKLDGSSQRVENECRFHAEAVYVAKALRLCAGKDTGVEGSTTTPGGWLPGLLLRPLCGDRGATCPLVPYCCCEDC